MGLGHPGAGAEASDGGRDHPGCGCKAGVADRLEGQGWGPVSVSLDLWAWTLGWTMRKCRQEKPVDWDDREGSRGSLSKNKDVREIDK